MKILKSLNRIFLLLVFVLFFNASSFSNEPIDIWNLDNNTKDNTDLEGYFQSIYYFKDHIDIIKKELSPKTLNHSHFTGLSYNSIIVAHVNYSV